MRFFNIAGVCFPDRHYMLAPEPRLPDVPRLADQGLYFVVHAPRQTGKTTSLMALAHMLTNQGKYAALHFSCEQGRMVGDNYGAAQRAVLDGIRANAERYLPAELHPPAWPEASEESMLFAALSAWAQVCPRPLVLFFDEIDALSGASLVSVLSQLRNGAVHRPTGFPHSVGVCGMRDVRDYKVASGGNPTRMGGASPFNIITKSLRLGDFTADEVAQLYGQHTADTGQEFTDEAVAGAFDYSQGQPWLVNALAYQVTQEMDVAPPQPITAGHIVQAKDRLILARQTHLDSLVNKLSQPEVRRVIEPLIAGTLPEVDDTFNDSVSYVRDLGLIGQGRPIRVANPIYREVIVRVLGENTEDLITADPRSFILDDGRLDFDRLLREFAGFWRQHGEVLTMDKHYHEAAPQLVMMGYLHRIVNGGGNIDREYGVGRGRIDLNVTWPYQAGGKRQWQQEAIELKVWRPKQPDPLDEGLHQLDEYLAKLGLDHGTLVIFDRRPDAPPPQERTEFGEQRTPSGRPVTLLRA